ncbi:hypothetical protein PVAP13_8KG242802 [Panicum virgatum]|uniref:Uncharacterized protein n=1 Tax=Panicum virgatum TaxID=38727 RepID=A0A8T0PJX7_PANVG|nr:hypothetical protein PVAP13_8KG242802 [Panicum virgatum]
MSSSARRSESVVAPAQRGSTSSSAARRSAGRRRRLSGKSASPRQATAGRWRPIPSLAGARALPPFLAGVPIPTLPGARSWAAAGRAEQSHCHGHRRRGCGSMAGAAGSAPAARHGGEADGRRELGLAGAAAGGLGVAAPPARAGTYATAVPLSAASATSTRAHRYPAATVRRAPQCAASAVSACARRCPTATAQCAPPPLCDLRVLPPLRGHRSRRKGLGLRNQGNKKKRK